MGNLESTQEFLADWEQLTNLAELRQFVKQHFLAISDEIFQQMKARANELSCSEVNRAVELIESLSHAAELSGRSLPKAIARMAQGNAARWQGQNQVAIAFYDEARDFALQAGNELEAARSQIGKMSALGVLGEYEQAVQTGEAIRPILLAHYQYEAVVNLDNSLGQCYRNLSQFEQASFVFNRAIAIIEQNIFSPDKVSNNLRRLLAMTRFNLSLVLADQNFYQEALQKAGEALAAQQQLGNTSSVAIYQETIAYYNLHLGQYNKALRLLDEAREVFRTHNMSYYLLHCELGSIHCYLELNQLERAVERCQAIKTGLSNENTTEAGKVRHYLGIALTRLGQYSEAKQAFEQARQIMEAIGTGAGAGHPLLKQAELHFRQNDYLQAEKLSLEASQIFEEQNLRVDQAACFLLLGRIRLAQNCWSEAGHWAGQTLAASHVAQTPLLTYQALLLLAEIAEASGDETKALQYYRASLDTLEQMRGRVSVEARATFIEDKETAFQGAIALSLKAGDWDESLQLVERGKSRGLVELLAGELDIRVRVRDEKDRPLIAQLESLRARRNELVSQMMSAGLLLANPEAANSARTKSEAITVQIRETEEQIKALIERLQIRNAAYAEDVVLQPPEARVATEYLDEATALVEYYVCRGEVLAFVVSRVGVKVCRHLATEKEINRQLSLLRLNLGSVTRLIAENLPPEQRTTHMHGLGRNAKALLQKFYRQLIRPLGEALAGFKSLIIVPHGQLHYLPFQALHNEASGRYLVQEWAEISYLPGGSLLKFCQQRGQRPEAEQGREALVMGYSGGNLAHCLDEARQIAELLNQTGKSQLYLEKQALTARFEAAAGQSRIIHLATHGQFRQDNPLFSSVLLADGEITAQDLFNRELKASLVTFSACETGLGTLGGGDELLGLSRACLYAGASSLLLSLWRVEDASVARLMQSFYKSLLSGLGKAAALRQAQLEMLEDETYAHPFFWSPFILIGHAGLL